MISSDLKHIFFDLDHTLWDFDRNSELAFKAIFKMHGIGVELRDFLDIYNLVNIDYWKRYRENRVSKEDLRLGRLRETFGHMEYQVHENKIQALADAYIRYLPRHNHLFEGVLETLEYLMPRYSLHIITNGFEEVQYQKLRASGIQGFFNTITTSEEAGCKKPHQGIFELAAEKAGAVLSQCIMVGDDFEADVRGAERVGMRAIYFNCRGQNYDGCEQITAMNQLPRFLKIKKL